jgi:primosomal protein N'
MYILSVIPISRGIPFNTLSYYSTDALYPGTLIEIPLGKQFIKGLVYESNSLIEAKTSIKQATFALKKIKSVIGVSPFYTALVEGLRTASTKTLTPIGSLAGIVINDIYLDIFQKMSDPEISIKKERPAQSVYGILPDRIDNYKRIIRGAFAEKKSVVLVAPSIRSVEYWYKTLQKGITSHSVMLHSKVTKRDQKSAVANIKNSERPLFICTTAQYSCVPRSDISTIILEDETSSLYKTNDRYEADMRVVIESISKSLGLNIVFGDTLPRFETLYKTESLELSRAFTPDKLVVVPTETYRTILPTETIELIRYCQKNKKSLFIFTNRKGLAPISRCADCGTSVDCPTCSLPIVLRYKTVEGVRERVFVCTNCGDTLPTTHICSYCASWNITPVSIGTESVYEAVTGIVEPAHVFTIDDELTPDTKTVDPLLSEIQKQKWFVMIGTQKMLPYIKGVDFVAIPFFDRLLSIPSPVAVEEVLRLVMLCNEKTKDTLIICTKKPDFSITKLLATKKIQEIIDTDMETRSILKYPPFGLLIKLSVTVPSAHREVLTQKIENFFENTDITLLPVRRISPDSMKLLCVWIIQREESFVQENYEEIQAFLQDLRFPYTFSINPSRF